MTAKSVLAPLVAASALTALLASLLPSPSGAADPGRDQAYTELAAYAQQIQNAEPDAHDGDYAALLHFVQDKVAPAAKPVMIPGHAGYVGSQECASCHLTLSESYAHTLHGRILLKNPRTPQEKLGCEACHGPGSEHVRLGGGKGVGGIRAFRNDSDLPVEERNAVCLSCHDKGERIYWRASTHETRGLACTNCHQIMRRASLQSQLAKPTEQETCFQCHKTIRAQTYRSSHMPIREGKITCSSCHNPHGTANASLLKEATVNDVCYFCHAEKRGPFLWEHPPVRENCLNCHDPHGSMNDFLLKVSMPRLCQQCHSVAGHPSSPQNPSVQFAFNRACANCHSAVHGSNAPAGMRFHR